MSKSFPLWVKIFLPSCAALAGVSWLLPQPWATLLSFATVATISVGLGIRLGQLRAEERKRQSLEETWV